VHGETRPYKYIDIDIHMLYGLLFLVKNTKKKKKRIDYISECQRFPDIPSSFLFELSSFMSFHERKF
jgi:hypothetical protein